MEAAVAVLEGALAPAAADNLTVKAAVPSLPLCKKKISSRKSGEISVYYKSLMLSSAL